MLTKFKKASRLIKNKKGFTLIEAIAVVAIIGVLSVVTGSLIASGSRSYLRQRENAAAKEISIIIAKEIERNLSGARTVFLQAADSNGNSDLPGASFVEGLDVIFTMDNPPFGSATPTNIYGQNGEFMYGSGDDIYSYFAEDEDERRAFYGDYSATIFFKAVQDGYGNYNAILIFVDVYKNGSRKYESNGRLVKLREASISTTSVIYSYTASSSADCIGNIEATPEKSYKAEYKNVVNMTTSYSYLYYTK